jgi:MoaA/NifB/PqqE/SkfB family radical SAM enzyme
MSIKKDNLYEMPWRMNNCPNGWIEPTTFCQLKCPLCFRGCDRPDYQPIHKDLELMKREVDSFIKDRNVQTISISGGEPLLYPQLDELIKYVKNKNLAVIIITNAILLDVERLKELKELKVDAMLLHVDNYQNRPNVKTIQDTNALRARYCEMFREVKGISLGFTFVASNDNLADLDELLKFYRANNDIIEVLNFTSLRDLFNYEKIGRIDHPNFEKVAAKIKEIYGIEYCAYIGKTVTDEIAWLWGAAVFSGKNFLGSTDGNLMRTIQEGYYKKNKRYLFRGSDISYSLSTIIKIIFNKSIIKILFKYIFLKNKEKINWQIILLINGPQMVNNIIDRCESCPHAMYWKGKLVPSCCYSRIANEQDEYINTLKYYNKEYS